MMTVTLNPQETAVAARAQQPFKFMAGDAQRFPVTGISQRIRHQLPIASPKANAIMTTCAQGNVGGMSSCCSRQGVADGRPQKASGKPRMTPMVVYATTENAASVKRAALLKGGRILDLYPKSLGDFKSSKFPLPLTTEATSFVQLHMETGQTPKLLCFQSYSDKTARFVVPLSPRAEIVNNITEKGPCLYVSTPEAGDFEFQCQRDDRALQEWIGRFREIGVRLRPFDEIYEFDAVVGEGSFGKVRVGRHRSSGAAVCLKSISKTNHRLFSFYHEIGIMRKIAHPYVCQLFASYEDVLSVHMILEYCPGGEVFEYLRNFGPLREEDAKVATMRLLVALDKIHSLGIVHRDIKTENLLLCDSKDPTSVKLIDFGLSAELGGPPLTARCGSPGFVAPEVLAGDGKGYNQKVDIFSAGAVLYTLMTGFAPFRGENPKEVLQKNSRCEFTFHQPEWKSASGSCIDIVKWMMSRLSENRPSAREALGHPWFGSALAEVDRNARQHAMPSSPRESPTVLPNPRVTVLPQPSNASNASNARTQATQTPKFTRRSVMTAAKTTRIEMWRRDPASPALLPTRHILPSVRGGSVTKALGPLHSGLTSKSNSPVRRVCTAAVEKFSVSPAALPDQVASEGESTRTPSSDGLSSRPGPASSISSSTSPTAAPLRKLEIQHAIQSHVVADARPKVPILAHLPGHHHQTSIKGAAALPRRRTDIPRQAAASMTIQHHDIEAHLSELMPDSYPASRKKGCMPERSAQEVLATLADALATPRGYDGTRILMTSVSASPRGFRTPSNRQQQVTNLTPRSAPTRRTGNDSVEMPTFL